MSCIAVSVIVPVYNVERYLVQCMDSIVSQTLKNIEIICIDDGSTDSCAEILDSYAVSDSRVKVIHKENGGYGMAVNMGIQASAGEYIGIVEPDDYILPEMFEKLYAAAQKYKCEIVKSDFYRFTDICGECVKQYCKTARSDENYYKIIDPSEDKSCFRFIMNTWCGIYCRDFVIKNKIFHNETPGASFQDNGFWFKGFCYAKQILFIDEPFYMNRRDNPGSSVSSREKVYSGNTEYALIYKFLEQNPEIKNKFIDVFMMKKFHTYIFNLKRISSIYRHEYIKNFSDEFSESRQKGELDKSVFTANEWTELMQIIRDPDEYYYVTESSRIKISAVIPIYNCEKYLRQCLDSLICQTLKDFEVICVDDGSADSSAEILNEYAAKDSRITVICSENKGAGAARNTGLRAACGKYVIFLDSDDWFQPDMFSAAYKKAEADRADITVFRSMLYDNMSGTENPCTYSLRTDKLPEKRPFSVNDMTVSVFRNFMGWAWDKLYKRSFILNNELEFQQQRTSNDMYFTFISLYKAGRITVCNDYLYHQRRNVTGSLSATRERSWECFYNALCKIRKELTAMGIWEKYQPDFVDYALHSCLWNLSTLNKKQGVMLMERLKNEWFDSLGITDAPSGWFREITEYKQYTEIISSGLSYSELKIQQLEFENEELKKRAEEMKIPVTVSENSISSQELDYYKYCLDETRKSLSYRIGRAVTWLPRKVRGW